MRFCMFEPGKNILNVRLDLWKYRRGLLPIQNVSQAWVAETNGGFVQVIRHVQNVLLGANSDFLEDFLSSMLTNVIANHDAVGLRRR